MARRSCERQRVELPHLLRFVLPGLASVLAFPPLHAQSALRTPPHVGYVYPAGGQIGTTVTISVGGQNLFGTTDAYVSQSGITARVVGYDRPLTQKEINDLRDKLQTLQEKRAAAFGYKAPEPKAGGAAKKQRDERGASSASTSPAQKPTWTPEDEKQMRELREQLAQRGNRQANPALAETVTVELKIPPEARVGTCDLRLETPAGLSNPAILQIGELPEFTKPVVTATSNPTPRQKRGAAQRPSTTDPADATVAPPVTINGQILPGQVDRYHFAAKQGQHITVAVSARALLPYLADAVPGWFQATLALYGPDGREVAYSDSFRFSPDPVVAYPIPQDGNYTIEIKDSIYRGREDFVYRIALGELPFVSSLYPLGGAFAKPQTFELSGWNLPGNTLTVDNADKSPGTFLLAVRNRGTLSNAVRFELDGERATPEAEPNDTRSQAHALTLPVVVDGRINRRGDADYFRFSGKAGDSVVAEVFARRLGSPLDSVLQLSDAAGRQIATNDDYEDKGAGLMTHHADSRLSLKLPADGTYFLRLTDVEGNGGPEYGYRLRVGATRPDFELRAVPSAVNVRPGSHVPITVYALRRDGFDGPITLALADAPPGFVLSGARIPAGQDKVQLTLGAQTFAPAGVTALSLAGAATINGTAVGHVAVPAEDMMQAFAYHHLVPAAQFLADVVGRPGLSCRLLTRGPIKIPAGGTAKVELSTAAPRGLPAVAAELNDAPEGISIKATSIAGNVVTVTLACDAAKTKPGLQGNLILNAFGERPNAKAAKGPQRSQRFPLGTAPALAFEVVSAPGGS